MMLYIVLILSFLLEGAITNIIPINSIFLPLFTLIAFVIIYPYLKKRNNIFILLSVIAGLLYDIVYTNSTFINTLTFILIAYIISNLYNYINYNIINVSIISLIIIVIYRIITYLLLCLLSYKTFNIVYLIITIRNSIILNIIYCIIIYLILKLISKKFKLRIY